MKGFFQRLFGGDGPNDKKVVRSESASPLEIEPFSHGLVRIQALDFFGPHTTSPNGKFHLIWLDRNPEGTIGGHRYEGHGVWTLLRGDGAILATGLPKGTTRSRGWAVQLSRGFTATPDC